MAWSSPGISLKGQAGQSILFGPGAPPANAGNVGDGWIDTTNGRLYAQKGSSGWPITYASLIGPSGSSVRVGTGSPSATNPPGAQDGDLFIQQDAPGGAALFGPRANSSWPSSSTSLVGKAGTQLTTVSQDPGPQYAASINAAVGDFAYQTTSKTFFQYTSTGWSSLGTVSGTNGTNGSQITTGTTDPGSTYGAVGDLFFNSKTQTFFFKTSTGWSNLGSVTGAQGAAGAASTVPGPQGQTGATGPTGASGLSVLSGTTAPTSSQGVDGQPAYINTAAGALYGAKASGAWPSTPLSLIGPQGPAGAQVYSGSGAPNSSNPGGTIPAGSFFIETDTIPNRLFGPYSTANGWPTTYTNMGGGSFLTTSGPPASNIGAVGDVAIDATNAFFYPPKTASGWTSNPINLIGPTGPAGPAAAVPAPTYRQSSQGYVWLNATANTAYNVTTALAGAGGSFTYGQIQLAEPMIAAGQIAAVAGWSPGGLTQAAVTANVLKNGSVVYTASSFMTQSSGAATSGYVKLASPVAFSAGDVLTMTLSFAATGNACVRATLTYLYNS